jgi:hypothetical protein
MPKTYHRDILADSVICSYSTTHTVQFLAVLMIFPETLPNKNSFLSGHAPANLATIRRLALSLIKQDPNRKIGIKASRKLAGWDLGYIKKLLKMG